ncbi:MAG: CCA tRNA nucleotidyltransferase [Tepidisphaerales bacterium]
MSKLDVVMELREAALHVLRELRRAGHTAYFAGGCVRDLLLGLKPKDYDIATSAPPGEVRRLFRGSQAVGAAFGVILVRMGGHAIEVATFRCDGDYSDGRRPDSVRFASPREDAERRDFTINGLFLDPLPDKPPAYPFGEVIDFVGGLEDLAARRLRAIGDPDRRFGEDHLRLLRAVRFAAAFELTLETDTARAIRRHAGHLRRIAPERVGDEMRRMLVPPTRVRAWSLLRELGLTPELFRFCSCAEQPMVSLVPHLPAADLPFAVVLATCAIEETAQFAEGDRPVSAESAGRAAGERAILNAVSPHAAAATVRGLRQAMRLSNEETDAMLELADGLSRLLLALPHPPVALRRRLLARAWADGLLTVLETLQCGGHFADALPGLLADLRRRRGDDNAPPPLLTGDDLAAAGLKPGPLFRRLLDMAYDAQLEGRVGSRGEALTLALAAASAEGTAAPSAHNPGVSSRTGDGGRGASRV